jgi:CheY-like chemotaxis protein
MKPYIETKRILLIEDDEALRAIMHRYLAEAGYAVTCAPFGEEGVRQVLENPCETFDVVISDYSLGGGISGGEAVNAMRQKCPDTSVLFISGHLLPPDLRRGEAFLQKPAMPELVLEEVARLIRAKADTIPPEPA